MSYLIIIAIIAMVAGPIFWVMPSPAQKKMAERRNYAITKGLVVKVAHIPQSHRQQVRKEPTKECAYYALNIPNPDKKQTDFYYCFTRNDQPAEWLKQQLPPNASLFEQALADLPEHIKAIDYQNTRLGIYWVEKGDLAMVDTLQHTLREVLEKLPSAESSI